MDIKKNPVQEAYRILYSFLHGDDNKDIVGAHIAMEEAIGYLGEALAE